MKFIAFIWLYLNVFAIQAIAAVYNIRLWIVKAIDIRTFDWLFIAHFLQAHYRSKIELWNCFTYFNRSQSNLIAKNDSWTLVTLLKSEDKKKTTIRTHTHKVLAYRCYTFRKLLMCFFCIYRKFSSSSQSNRFQQNICQFQLIALLMWIYRNNIIEHNIKCTYMALGSINSMVLIQSIHNNRCHYSLSIF